MFIIITADYRAFVSVDGVTLSDLIYHVDVELELDMLAIGQYIELRGLHHLAKAVRRTANGSVVCTLAKASAGRKARAVQA